VSSSTGIAIWLDEGEDLDTLIRSADVAREDEKNSCRFSTYSDLIEETLIY